MLLVMGNPGRSRQLSALVASAAILLSLSALPICWPYTYEQDGGIATGELVTALRSLGQNVDEAEARRFLEDAGVVAGANDIDLAAFLAVAGRKMGARQSEARLAECFDVFDDACSGSIPAEQLRQVMVSHGDRLTEEEGLRRGHGRTDCGGFCGERREAGAVYNRDLIIFALHVTRSMDEVLSIEHIREICRYIYNMQNEDGGWGTHTLGPSSMFGTCVNYATLRILGEVLDGENDALSKGRSWILSHGSATAAPQWAKIYLSMIGVYDWARNNAIIPELWMLPHFLPIHPGRFWCFCRMVYMPMAYIYGKKFVGPITTTILEIRNELYNIPYNKINWNKACNSCAKATDDSATATAPTPASQRLLCQGAFRSAWNLRRSN